MSLFEDGSKETHHFPTLPAFLYPVEVKDTPQYGSNHKGVFSLGPIPKNTKFWVWTERVIAIPHEELEDYIAKEFGTTSTISNFDAADDNNNSNDEKNRSLEAIQLFLRQGFVLPPSSSSSSSSSKDDGNGSVGKEDQFFYSNPTDAGRFMNHSNDPNCGPDGTLRDISPGEEMTMDYSFHGNPKWYQDICQKYNVLTERQIAEQQKQQKSKATITNNFDEITKSNINSSSVNDNNSLEAELQYLVKPEKSTTTIAKSSAQYVASQAGDAKEATHSGEYIHKTVLIHNGRPFQHQWSLDKHGFRLVSNVSTKVQDFYNDQEIESIYNAEIVELLKTHIPNVEKIHIFDHTRRSSSSKMRTTKMMREPSSVIHNDYTEWSANKRLKEIMGGTEEYKNISNITHDDDDGSKSPSHSYSRFAIVNVWRPILSSSSSGANNNDNGNDTTTTSSSANKNDDNERVVEAWPLTICDSTTLCVEKDIVSVPRISKIDGRKGEIQMAYFSERHQWYYFPKMTQKEIILLKTYDSSPNVNRYTIHTAFDLVNSKHNKNDNDSNNNASSSGSGNIGGDGNDNGDGTGSDSNAASIKSRESIETRAFVFFK